MAKRKSRPRADPLRAIDRDDAIRHARPRVAIPDAALSTAAHAEPPADPTHANGLDETPATPAIDIPARASVDPRPVVLTAKPVSPPTARLVRMAWDKFTREVADIAAECAVQDGIDQSCYRLGLLSFPPEATNVAWVPR